MSRKRNVLLYIVYHRKIWRKNENTTFGSFYLWKINTFYHTVYCHDDFYFNLWSSGWVFCIKFRRKDTFFGSESHHAVFDDRCDGGIYVRNGRYRFSGQNAGRGREKRPISIFLFSFMSHLRWVWFSLYWVFFFFVRWPLYWGRKENCWKIA